MEEFKLPENFLLGTATSSTQVEGGDTNNTWYKWCEEGHTKDASSCITANDHWNRLEEDIGILKSLNVQSHRMSIEWSRIEPSKGCFSMDAIGHYRYEIGLLLKNNIQPLVTLHHFSEPLWFHSIGAWEKEENTALFLEYVRYVVENLGDLVSEWVVFNEPNIYSLFGYTMGLWPPGKVSVFSSFKTQSQIIRTHVEAYKLIHEIRDEKGFKGKTMVGCAMHIRIFKGASFLDRIVAAASNYIFNHLFMEGTTTGKIGFPLPKKGFRYTKGRYADFLGINYYTRNIVEFTLNPSTWFYKEIPDNDHEKTDLGWSIYPQGIYRICRKYYNKYKLPIYITESGISDKSDQRKPGYICSHLYNVAKAIKEGIPVQRYYYWTLMDNFEWTDGETTHFGLVECNFKNQERKIRDSGRLYAEICKRKGLTEDMIDSYLRKRKTVGVG